MPDLDLRGLRHQGGTIKNDFGDVMLVKISDEVFINADSIEEIQVVQIQGIWKVILKKKESTSIIVLAECENKDETIREMSNIQFRLDKINRIA